MKSLRSQNIDFGTGAGIFVRNVYLKFEFIFCLVVVDI